MSWVALLSQALRSQYLSMKEKIDTLRVMNAHSGRNLAVGRRSLLKRCSFGNYCKIYDHCRLVDISLGDRTYISEECRLYDVTIGKYCAIGPRVTMGLGIHPSRKFVAIHPLFYSKTNSACMEAISDSNYFTEHKCITIGHDVWIGANTIIQDGLVIGNGAIIGSGAVVTRDVPAYAVVAGVPAAILRYRLEKEQIDFLQKFCWWDKDMAWLRNHYQEFHDIERFMAHHIHACT